MQISDEDLRDLQEEYAQDFDGETISTADAREMAQRLLAFYQLISQPLPGSANKETCSRHSLASEWAAGLQTMPPSAGSANCAPTLCP